MDELNINVIKQKLNKYEMLNNQLKEQLKKYKSLNIDDYEATFKKMMFDTFEYCRLVEEEGEKKDAENAEKYVKSIINKVDENDIKYIENIIEYLKSMINK